MELTLNDYAVAAMRTAADKTNEARWFSAEEQGFIIAGLGLAGEAGEFADHVKKWFAQGHPLDLAKLDKEAGDILWYLARYAAARGLPLGTLAEENIEKLRVRFPDGFETARSLNRVEEPR